MQGVFQRQSLHANHFIISNSSSHASYKDSHCLTENLHTIDLLIVEIQGLLLPNQEPLILTHQESHAPEAQQQPNQLLLPHHSSDECGQHPTSGPSAQEAQHTVLQQLEPTSAQYYQFVAILHKHTSQKEDNNKHPKFVVALKVGLKLQFLYLPI